jgi:hypothetical protein
MSTDSLSTADFDTLGTTAFCDTAITYSSWSTVAYNDFSLNSSGLSNISKTGISKFGGRFVADASGEAPTWSTEGTTSILAYMADYGSNKPKLVVEHASAGPAGLKNYNGVLKASIKNIDGVAIASIKSLDGVS